MKTKLLSDLALMGSILLSRLGGVLIIFILVAKSLPLDSFGIFAYCYSLSAIIAVCVDYGFSQSLLHDIGRNPSSANQEFKTGILIKLALASLTITLAITAAQLELIAVGSKGIFVILLFAAILTSFIEYIGTSLRAIGHYRQEAKLQVASTILIISLVAVVANQTQSLIHVATAMLLGKLVQLASTIRISKAHYPNQAKWCGITNTLIKLKNGFPFAIDQGITNILTNIDVLIVSAILGTGSAGIYQAGQRLLQGFSAIALMISNVFLPRLSRYATTDPIKFSQTSKYASAAMLSIGSLGLLIFFTASSQLVLTFYDEKFIELIPLLPYFGALILARFTGGAFGLRLVALGLQKQRMFANTLGLAIVVVASQTLISRYGNIGMVLTQILAVTGVILAYGAISWNHQHNDKESSK